MLINIGKVQKKVILPIQVKKDIINIVFKLINNDNPRIESLFKTLT